MLKEVHDAITLAIQAHGAMIMGVGLGFLFVLVYASSVFYKLKGATYSSVSFWICFLGMIFTVVPMLAYGCSSFGETCVLGLERSSATTKALGILGAYISIVAVFVVPVLVAGFLGQILAWIAWSLTGFSRMPNDDQRRAGK